MPSAWVVILLVFLSSTVLVIFDDTSAQELELAGYSCPVDHKTGGIHHLCVLILKITGFSMSVNAKRMVDYRSISSVIIQYITYRIIHSHDS